MIIGIDVLTSLRSVDPVPTIYSLSTVMYCIFPLKKDNRKKVKSWGDYLTVKETEKMIKFYKSRIKINIVSLSIILFLMASVAIFILANYSWLWRISPILFGMNIIFLVLLFLPLNQLKNYRKT